MKPIRVYIAGPVTSSGTQAENASRALEVAEMLVGAGCLVFVPHLYFMWELKYPKSHEEMMAMCKGWLLQCQAVVRLPGHSKGADMEETWARDAGIPVFKQKEEYAGDYRTPAKLFLAELRSGRVRTDLGVVDSEAERLRAKLVEAERERDAYKRAKQENDERFQNERDDARAEVERLRAGLRASNAEIERLTSLAGARGGEVERLRADSKVVGYDDLLGPLISHGCGEVHLYPVLAAWQQEVTGWLKKQPFYPQQPWQPLLGIGEELGELNHAFLKRSQGIRGTAEKHRVAMEDAVGDIMVYLAGFCAAEGLDLGGCLKRAWGEVSKRDWNANPDTGTTNTGATNTGTTNTIKYRDKVRINIISPIRPQEEGVVVNVNKYRVDVEFSDGAIYSFAHMEVKKL